MRTAVWRSVYTLAITACAAAASGSASPSQSAPAQDVAIPKDRCDLLQSVLRDELVKALDPLELKGSESKSEEIRVKNGFPPIDLKIGQIDYKVSAAVRFPDVARDLKLAVESLVKHDARTLRGKLSASTPAAGHIGAELGPIKAHADFHATAVIESVDVEVDWTIEPKTGALVYKPKVTALKTVVRDVKFDGDLAKIFGVINDLGQKAANSWLSQNEGKFRDAMNAALEKAFRDGRLRLAPEELVGSR
jgi:hypothetical protein